MVYLMNFISIMAQNVWAQSAEAPAAAAAAPGASTAPVWMQYAPFAGILAIFYFLILRPQAKKQKLQQAFLTQLKKGDEVLTSSGIFGKIEGLTEKFVTLEIANDVKIRIVRSQIFSPAKEVKE